MTLRATLIAVCLCSIAAFANSTGINSAAVGTGCVRAGCHTPTAGAFTMPVPTVTITPSANTATVGQQLTLTVMISAPNNRAGFNLRTDNGTLTTTDPGARTLGGEVTHRAAKLGSNGQVTFSAIWTAGSAGTATFNAFGNSVNGDGSATGDNFNTATASVTVTCSATAETCDGADNDCNGAVDDGDLCPAGQSCTAGVCQAASGGGGGASEAPGGCSTGTGMSLAWFGAFAFAFGLRFSRRTLRG